MRQAFLMNFSLSLQKIPLSEKIYNTCSETDFSSYFCFLPLSNESMTFPVNTVCLLQSLHASHRPIKAADLLHTFSLAHASTELSSKIGLLCFSPSDQPTPRSLRLLSASTLCLPPFIQSCILKGYVVSLHEAVSLI